jgi:SAM-dependent methyltransferase
MTATEEMARTLRRKPLLREWYEGIYAFLAANRAEGDRNLEIGSGSSLLYEHIPNLIRSNVLPVSGLDVVCSAYAIPFDDESLDNIFLISVLHHLGDPIRFFREASRVLRPNGRLLISDPYVSLLSWFPWTKLHPEHCDLRTLGFDLPDRPNPLMDANSANLTILFARGPRAAERAISPLILERWRFHSKFHYWLAGGYNFPQLVPTRCRALIAAAEWVLSPLDRFLASFAFAVLRKPAAESAQATPRPWDGAVPRQPTAGPPAHGAAKVA